MSNLPIIKLTQSQYCDIPCSESHGIYITEEGTFYCENGDAHRLDGPAEEWNDGDKFWLKNGEYHRDDGPALEMNDGTKIWFVNGLRHRINGPAVEYPMGIGRYYLHNVEYSKEDYCIEMYILNNGLEIYE